MPASLHCPYVVRSCRSQCRTTAVRNVAVRGGRDDFRKRSMGGQGGFDGGSELSGMFGSGGGDGLDLGRGIDLSRSQSGDDPLNYDPEGLFKGSTTLQDGHIQRRAMFKSASAAEDMEKEMEKQKERTQKEADARRAAVVVPSDPAQLVQFYLDCDAADMEYFVAKGRHLIDDEFWAALDNAIGQERFLPEPNEDALAELEGLRDYVKQVLLAQDSVTQGVQSATERLKALLTARDKRQCILDMASRNEIDAGLLQLLQQNIDGAAKAGQADAAEFMTKIRNACQKYVIARAKPSEEERAKIAVQQQQQGQPSSPGDEASGSASIILP